MTSTASDTPPLSPDTRQPDGREISRLQARKTQRARTFAASAGEAEAALSAAATELRTQAEAAHAQLAAEHSRALKGTRERLVRERAAAVDRLLAVTAPFDASPAAATWTASAAWEAVPGDQLPPIAVRVGSTSVPAGAFGEPAVPYAGLAPGLGAGHLHVIADAEMRREAIAAVQSTLLRLVAGARPGSVHFQIFDPLGFGATLNDLNRFAADVRHGEPITTPRQFEDALERLSTHSTRVTSTQLRGQFTSLRQLMELGGEVDVTFEILVVLDAPTGIAEDIRERLERLAARGAELGVFVLLLQSDPRAMIDLGPASSLLRIANGQTTLTVPGAPAVQAALDPPAPSSLIGSVAQRAVPEVAALPFEALQPDGRFGEDSSEGLRVPLGMSGPQRVAVELGDVTPHALVAGATGTGKSNLLSALIYGLTRRYDTDQLELYLLDFKGAVEFQEFAPTPDDRSYLPHASVVSLNSSRAFGAAVLRHIDGLVSERYRILGERSATKLAEYHRGLKPDDVRFPRVVVVLDEFQRLFAVDDAIAARAVTDLRNIAEQGRAAGVHLVLATQTIGAVGAGTTIGLKIEPVFKNASLRIGLRLPEEDARQLMSNANTAPSDLLGRGLAIVNDKGGHLEGNREARIAYVSPKAARDERLEAVARTGGARRPPRIFNGRLGADPAHNRALRSALRAQPPTTGTWPTWVAESLQFDAEYPREQPGVEVSLGRDRHRNLAIVGPGARTAIGLLQWSAIGLAATDRSSSLLLVDLTRPEDVRELRIPAGAVEATAAAIRGLGAAATIVRSDDAEAVTQAIERFAAEAADGPRAVLLFGADRLHGLDNPVGPVDPDAFDEPPTWRSRLIELIADGPRSRLHTFAWWATGPDFARMQDAHESFGLRAYLGLTEQQLFELTLVESTAPEPSLALWQDVGRGGSLETVHVYEPFGTTDPSPILS